MNHTDHVSGTEGYEDEAPMLIDQYERLAFEDVHRHVLSLFPPAPGPVLDIGAGTGRDAAGLAARGYDVTALEPTRAMREAAMSLHASPRIEWLDDALPDLVLMNGRAGRYALILLTAVWMHMDADQRRLAMPRVVALLKPSGVMAFSLRHGPIPPGRRMFDVSVVETINLAEMAGCQCVLQQTGRGGGLNQSGVSWSRLVFKLT